MKNIVDEAYKKGNYYPTIGIECHVQLKTKTKLFSSVSNEAREALPNSLISHVCFGLPGALPVLNKEAVRLAARAAYALGTVPQKYSKFDRKHYFYPDLPKGYQISQFDEPIILGGAIDIHLEDGSSKTIAITRAHLEEDAGKSTHPVGADYSLVDLNRSGTPLLEIVSEPEIHSAKEAKAYARELWLRMKYAGVSDVDLYHGNMRFDVNVSVSTSPTTLGIRSETKNLNSFRSVERAVEFEIERQIALLEKGEQVVQETRGWLDDKQKTVSQRSKEDAHDYRYFPDPDIPPVMLSDKFIEEVANELATMPDEWRRKLDHIGLDTLITESLLEAQVEFDSDFLETICSAPSSTAKNYANWVVNIELPLKRLASGGDPVLKVGSLRRISIFETALKLIESGKVSSNGVKKYIEVCFLEPSRTDRIDENFEEIAKELGILQINNADELEKIVQRVIIENPKPANDVRLGELKAIGFLVGQVMKLSGGKANPAEAQKILKEKLGV